MIKYVLTPNGVINRETGMTIKEGLASSFWQEYLAWVAEGNTPVPMKPSAEYSLAEDEDEWVFNQAIADSIALGQAKANLKEKMLELFEFVFALFTVLKDKGAISAQDFDAELIAKAQVWKGFLDDISNLE